MEFNRNQFFFVGLFLLLVGLQFRVVQTYVLTPEATQFIAERRGSESVASADNSPFANFAAQQQILPQSARVVQPPEWLGWCLMSIGAVLILHSLAMPKPG